MTQFDLIALWLLLQKERKVRRLFMTSIRGCAELMSHNIWMITRDLKIIQIYCKFFIVLP